MKYLKENKIEILHAIIITQNDLQRVQNDQTLSAWDKQLGEQRLINALIHLKETLFEINLKEYQLENRNKKANVKKLSVVS